MLTLPLRGGAPAALAWDLDDITDKPQQGKRKMNDSDSLRGGDWICTKCKNHNFARRTECKRCSAPAPSEDKRYKGKEGEEPAVVPVVKMKGGDWLCSKCGSHNFARRTKCMSCNNEAPSEEDRFKEDGEGKQGKEVGLRDGDWLCPACNNHNFKYRTSCNRCLAPAPPDGSRIQGQPGTVITDVARPPLQQQTAIAGSVNSDWSCTSPSCGKVNFGWRKDCYVCGSPSPSAAAANFLAASRSGNEASTNMNPAMTIAAGVMDSMGSMQNNMTGGMGIQNMGGGMVNPNVFPQGMGGMDGRLSKWDQWPGWDQGPVEGNANLQGYNRQGYNSVQHPTMRVTVDDAACHLAASWGPSKVTSSQLSGAVPLGTGSSMLAPVGSIAFKESTWIVQARFPTLSEDWTCSACGNLNFKRRGECNRCGSPHPGWKCPGCGADNLARHTACKSCHVNFESSSSVERYKTRLCKNFKQTGYCKLGKRCRFAHGEEELPKPVENDDESKLNAALESSTNAEELISACMSKKGMPVSEVIAALGKLCRFQTPGEKALAVDPRVQSLFAAAGQQATELQIAQLVRLLHCAATLGATGEGFMTFVPLLEPAIPQLKADGLAGVAWALEHVSGGQAGQLLEQLAEASVSVMEDFSLPSLMSMLKITFRNQIRVDSLLQTAGDKLGDPNVAKDLNATSLAELASGYADLGFNHEALLQVVADSVVIGWMTRFSSKELADIAYAFWALGCHNREMMQRIGDITNRRLHKFSVEQLEKIQCSYGACGFQVPDEWMEKCVEHHS